MKYSKRSILASLLSLVASLFFGVSAAQAIEYGGLGIYPSLSEVDKSNPFTRSWFIYTVEPGEIRQGNVDIKNSSPEAQEILLYPVDAVTTKDGAFAPEPEGKEKVDVGAWITLAESEIFLKSRETKTVPFTMRVPAHVEVGDHMGALIVQSKSVPELSGSGLRIATRVGARMYITVSGDVVRDLKFTDFIAKQADGNTTFEVTFTNNGNVRVRQKGEIEITNMFGKFVETLQIPEREVFPGKTITVPVEWPKNLFLGKYSARATVTDDANKVFTRELSFFVASVGQISIGAGLALGIFAILLVVLFVVRKKRLKKRKKKEIGQ